MATQQYDSNEQSSNNTDSGFFKNLKHKCKQIFAKTTQVAIITTIAITGVSAAAEAFPDGKQFGISPASNTGLNVDQYGDGFTNSKTPAHLWDGPLTPTSDLVVTNRGSGYSAEIALASNRNICLGPDVGLNANAIQDGTPVVFKKDCTNTLNWFLSPNQEIQVAKNPKFCLDIPGQQFNKYQKLQVYTCNGTAAQKFTLKGLGTQPVNQPSAPAPTQQTPTQSNTPKPVLKTAGIGWNAPIIFDLNPISPTFSHLLLGDGKKAHVNVNAVGDTWTYFGKEEGQYLVYNMKLIINDYQVVKYLGGTSFVTQFSNLTPANRIASGVLGAASLFYEQGGNDLIIKAEFCMNKDSGFWIDAKGGTMFLSPQLKCDK